MADIPTYFVLEFNIHVLEAKGTDRPKYGTSCVPGRLNPGRGTQKLKYGTSREIRTVGNPTSNASLHLVKYNAYNVRYNKLIK